MRTAFILLFYWAPFFRLQPRQSIWQLSGVVAVAKHCFALKMPAIVPKLLFYVGQLGIKLVLLGYAGPVQTGVSCHGGFLSFVPELFLSLFYRFSI